MKSTELDFIFFFRIAETTLKASIVSYVPMVLLVMRHVDLQAIVRVKVEVDKFQHAQ